MQIRRLPVLALALLMSIGLFAGEAWATRVEIIISKVSQKMTVKVDGDTEYVWPVSTGAAKYETPTGRFKPFRMEAEHFSKEWDDAPMPHSIFFTGEGHAIHGSYHVKSLGKKASHGCVRLSPENAAVLFSLVQSAGMSNTSVELKGGFFDFSSGRRSFSQVGNDIDKVVNNTARRGLFFNLGKPKAQKPKAVVLKTVKKPAAKPAPKVVSATPAKAVAKPKAVDAKCVAKAGQKACPVPAAAAAAKTASNG